MSRVPQTPNEPRWRPVPGFEGYYQISDVGQLVSIPRSITRIDGRTADLQGKELRQRSTPRGHLMVTLSRDGIRTHHLVHRLVLGAFVGPAPEGSEGCHNNGDPADNRVENLRWGTRSENTTDAVRHGTHHQTRKTHCTHGHPFDAANTISYGSARGGRRCRACKMADQRARRAQRRASA